jgi:hypothetical protein
LTELDDLERIETAFAVLYRSDSHVYKLRKPVDVRGGSESRKLGTAGARRSVCEPAAGGTGLTSRQTSSTHGSEGSPAAGGMSRRLHVTIA